MEKHVKLHNILLQSFLWKVSRDFVFRKNLFLSNFYFHFDICLWQQTRPSNLNRSYSVNVLFPSHCFVYIYITSLFNVLKFRVAVLIHFCSAFFSRLLSRISKCSLFLYSAKLLIIVCIYRPYILHFITIIHYKKQYISIIPFPRTFLQDTENFHVRLSDFWVESEVTNGAWF